MKKITVLCKGALDKAVPIISIAQALRASGNKVSIICSSISHGLKKELTEIDIKVISLEIEVNNFNTRIGKLGGKLFHWLKFRIKTEKILKAYTENILYVGTADTAIALRGILDKHKYILHLRELYDQYPIYMKLIKKPAQQAVRVVVPEENRAYLYYIFLKLKSIPLIIPNKPFYHPAQAKMPIDFLGEEIKQKLIKKKNIIYQGPIHTERNIEKLIRVCAMLPDFNLILMGEDHGLIESYRAINPNIIHIPFVRPPLHLNITSWAYIGVISYDFHSLNTIYCAPNKIWEFSGFGIPVLCNINPGIKYIIDRSGAGVAVDFNKDKEIIAAINLINDNHEQIRMKAWALYNSESEDVVNLIG